MACSKKYVLVHVPENRVLQWNLSKPNLLVTILCVLNKQVFGLYKLK
jgi:hypothetical protein